jgi:uncharacterized protein (DUF2141 family)
MKRAGYSILFAMAGMLLAGPARPQASATATLTVRVEGVLPAGGVLRLGLYDAARYPDDDSKPVAAADVPATSPETVITLHAPPGVYAIQTFQDVNANDRMDTTWVGLPLEPFGFSRDAKPFLSKPSFDAVKFTLVAGENSQVLHLQNFSQSSPTNRARESIRARQRK